MRDFFADVIDIFDVEIHPSFFGNGQHVKNRVRASTHRHINRKGIAYRFFIENVSKVIGII